MFTGIFDVPTQIVQGMHRIIYFDINLGYKATNAINRYQLMDKQIEIIKRGYSIICVLNLDNRTITQKCDSFSTHAGFIEQCYPNIAKNQISNMPLTELTAV
jgi:hypothetical protein